MSSAAPTGSGQEGPKLTKGAIINYTSDPPQHNDIVAIAAACHTANRAYDMALDDNSQIPWWELNEETLDSVIDGVCNALNGATPEQSHANWMEFKRFHGWCYGPVKDPEIRTHPCMVSYAALPEEQKRKDHIFVEMVRAVGAQFSWFAGTPAGKMAALGLAKG